ncbi:AmpG family muropeptide MFS transporter [Caenimonas sedimenti]|uniref:AmpG family muropeptide MFS transporter n=1 Tax=Caenimonas sedimenti TaxID=2596921 RepID=A0A562ZRI8_9BURK|nr:AmpG family muropeptide MFS transporter [Caenimonas sedimenti]TWO70966.1 AmpG family muropeptide MFS transporter [Caenimonas sedimenti]
MSDRTASSAQTATAPPRWSDAMRVYLQAPMLRMLFLGFAAGLPLLLVLGTLSFRLREAGIDRATIGFLSWVGLAYAFKWVWAPLVDRVPVPLLSRALGQRRAWLLTAQLAIIAGLVGMAMADPREGLQAIIWCAVLVAFGSATQDIALDAFRIESAASDQQAALAATYQTGYRLAMIWAGAGVLWIAARAEVADVTSYQHAAWRTAYFVMAGSMLVGVLTVFFSREPLPRDAQADRSLRAGVAQQLARHGLNFSWPQALLFVGLAGLMVAMVRAPLGAIGWPEAGLYVLALVVGGAGLWQGWGAARPQHVNVPASIAPGVAWLQVVVVEPFAEFLRRYGWHALLILALISVYRISDIVMGIMANPFYVDMGYTKDEVAAVTKIYGVIMTLVGAFVGGVLSMRFGVMRVLMLGAILSAASNLLFAWLGTRGHDVTALVLIVSADNLSSGIASAAFVAYLSGLTNIGYSATQYALFSSVMLLLPKYLAGFSGQYVNAHGYVNFFTATAFLGVPVLLLVWLASKATPVGAEAVR